MLTQVHNLGMKLGVYLDSSNVTCNGYPGSGNHLQQDAQQLANWGLDMVFFNSCSVYDHRKYSQGKLKLPL